MTSAHAEISAVGHERSASSFDLVVRFRESTTSHADDGRAFFRKCHTDRLPDAPASAGDNDYFVFKFHKVRSGEATDEQQVGPRGARLSNKYSL